MKLSPLALGIGAAVVFAGSCESSDSPFDSDADSSSPDSTEVDSDIDTDSDVDTDSDIDTDSQVEPDTDIDTEPTACLTYPVPLAPIGREATVTAAITGVDPEATVTWNSTRDTPSRLAFDVVLSACSDDEADLYDAVWEVFEDTPDAFLLDRDDWGTNNAPCRIVTEGRVRTVQFYRERVGTVPIARDVVSAVLRRDDGVVHMTAMSGTYLPPATEALDADLSACPTLVPQDVQAAVLGGTFDYATFEQCQPTGRGSYDAQPPDAFMLGTSVVWSWYESDGGIVFEKTIDGEFHVDGSHWTAELLQSTAYCPAADDRDATMGWNLRFDAVTGEWLSSAAGLGCLVC